jgi:hypothetical protein
VRVHVQVFETCIDDVEWRYLRAWIALSGDEERLAACYVASPKSEERTAQLHRVASSINSMAISITRMAWFQVLPCPALVPPCSSCPARGKWVARGATAPRELNPARAAVKVPPQNLQ